MKILITGDRSWTDRQLIHSTLCELNAVQRITLVIEGGARGADTLGRQVAEELGIDVDEYPAEWETHGRQAGILRNARMLTEGKPDMVLAFHDDLANSKGTGHMVRTASAAGVPVHHVQH